ncbi:MAG: methyltransferase domain-containing protein [Aestuariibacter sp.]|nr:methyltransferase domain-containing protein [Aestuariibacter sp.]
MPTSNQDFDSYLETWKHHQTMPWSRIRLKVEISNLFRHVGQSGLKILDAGGGNGYACIPFAQNGCQVVVADYSEAMLIDGQRLMSELGLDKNVSFVLTRLKDLSNAIYDQDFDVVLCHNVLQYVESIPVVLQSILQPLKSQGVVSIICMNRYSIAYHQAFLHDDLQAAKAAIGATETNTIFGSTARALDVDEMVKLLEGLGCVIQADYGVRCMLDYWGDNERKTEPNTVAQLEELELALSAKYPYKLLARFFQVIAQKA